MRMAAHLRRRAVFVSLTMVPAVSCVGSAIPFVFYRVGGHR